MSDPITSRILREAGSPELLATLAERLAPTDLKSLLLRVYRLRAARMSPREVLQAYALQKLPRPSGVDARLLAELRRLAYTVLPEGFEALELSPVAPLGVVSVLTNLDQNQALATVGACEVCSDPTNVLALECALRRSNAGRQKGGSAPAVSLATTLRCLRPQTEPAPGVVPHFELLALCSAGSDPGNHAFESGAFLTHIRTYIAFLEATRPLGLRCAKLRVALTAFSEAAAPWLRAGVERPLRQEGHAVDAEPERGQGRNYYGEAAFHVYGTSADGKEHQLADGGLVGWTQVLLGNRKERLLISGLGLERLGSLFS